MMTRIAIAAVLLGVAVAAQAQTMTAVSGSERRHTLVLRSDGSATVDGMQPEPQTKDDLLEGLDRLGANAKEKNEVNLDKNMMALAHRGDLSSKMDMIVVRNYEFAARGMYSPGDLDTLRRKLNSNGWSHLIRNESEGETNDIVVKTGADGLISDMVILNVEPREINVVHLRGHFKMEDVNGAMGSAMGMGGGMFGMAGAMGHMGGGSSTYSHTTTTTRSSNNSNRTSPAPAAPSSPTAPTAPKAPTAPSAPKAPTAPSAPAAPTY